MGIGRREFLKLFGTTLAILATPSSIAILDDLYINRKLGLAFSKPRGWHFADVQQMGEILNGEMLDLDAKIVQKIKAQTDLPLVSISQEPLTNTPGNFTPGLHIYVDDTVLAEGDLEKQRVLSPRGSFERDVTYQGKILRQFEVLSPLVLTTISQCAAYEYSAAFTFAHVNLLAPVRVRMRSLLIVQEPVWYTLRLYDAPYLGEQYRFDYSGFIHSLQLI